MPPITQIQVLKHFSLWSFQIQDNLAPKSVSALPLVLVLEPANASDDWPGKAGGSFAILQNS